MAISDEAADQLENRLYDANANRKKVEAENKQLLAQNTALQATNTKLTLRVRELEGAVELLKEFDYETDIGPGGYHTWLGGWSKKVKAFLVKSGELEE